LSRRVVACILPGISSPTRRVGGWLDEQLGDAMRLQGKVALVTAAGSGIGHAVAELFAAEGAHVFAGDAVASPLPHAAGIEAVSLDVSSEIDWERAVDIVFEKWGRLDVLVNNAAILSCEPLHELELTSWDRTIAIDQTGVFLGMREAVRVMRRQKSGSIVNISSFWGSSAAAGAHAYQAAAGAIRHMSQNAAMTYVLHGIRVNSVYDGRASDVHREAIASSPTQRGAQAIEVAHGCLFLASDEASHITGAELAIDGGYLGQ